MEELYNFFGFAVEGIVVGWIAEDSIPLSVLGDALEEDMVGALGNLACVAHRGLGLLD